MPKKTDRDIILQSYVLRRQGKTLDEILDDLSKEFDEDRIPDRSTISRYMKRFESKLPEELAAEDAPFKWSEMKAVPWEGSHVVMGAYAHYIANGGPDFFGPFTNRNAMWIYRVSQALGPQGDMSLPDSFEARFGEDFEMFLLNKWREGVGVTALYEVPPLPTRFDLIIIAREYSLREIHSILFSVEFDTRDLDLWLAFAPWNSPIQISKYNMARDAFGGFQRILWHSEEVEWLNLVDPKTAAFVKENSPDEIPDSEPPDEGDKTIVSVLDGLLPSQRGILLLWLKAVKKDPVLGGVGINLWYLEFYRRAQIARVQNDETDSLKDHHILLRQIQEELNERQHQASKQK